MQTSLFLTCSIILGYLGHTPCKKIKIKIIIAIKDSWFFIINNVELIMLFIDSPKFRTLKDRHIWLLRRYRFHTCCRIRIFCSRSHLWTDRWWLKIYVILRRVMQIRLIHSFGFVTLARATNHVPPPLDHPGGSGPAPDRLRITLIKILARIFA